MGNKCCTDRKEPKVGRTILESSSEQSGKGKCYSGKAQAKPIKFHSKGDDAATFDRAFEANDLEAFVQLLSSSQVIESFDQRMHPWAEDPKTVGSLAGTQFAILASMADQQNDTSMKIRIREAGAIPALVDFLRSTEPDRVQTAVVALSFLTANCEENAHAVFDAGALEMLMRHLDSPVAGMRVATSTTLRNISVVNEACRKQFVRLGGLGAIVSQLSQTPHPSLSHVDVQLESVLNLQDIIEDEDGNVIPEFGREAQELGAEAKLTLLLEAADEEVRATAQELLDVLAAMN